MNISYGPPGHKGVTHLMAIGADDLDEGPADRAARIGTYVALGAIGVGVLMKSSRTRTLGIGAALALLAVRLASRRAAVSVTSPAPPPPLK